MQERSDVEVETMVSITSLRVSVLWPEMIRGVFMFLSCHISLSPPPLPNKHHIPILPPTNRSLYHDTPCSVIPFLISFYEASPPLFPICYDISYLASLLFSFLNLCILGASASLSLAYIIFCVSASKRFIVLFRAWID